MPSMTYPIDHVLANILNSIFAAIQNPGYQPYCEYDRILFLVLASDVMLFCEPVLPYHGCHDASRGCDLQGVLIAQSGV
jgi:hypothetical protein